MCGIPEDKAAPYSRTPEQDAASSFDDALDDARGETQADAESAQTVAANADGDTVELSDESKQADGGEMVTIAKSELDALREAAAEADSYRDMSQRTRAELLNYQKRVRKEVELIRETAIHDFVGEVLPILDDFSRAIGSLDAVEDNQTADYAAFAEGVRMIEAHLHRALETHQIKPIEAKGQPFDPNYHEALMQQPSTEYEEGTVIEELRRGYVAGDRVLRAAQVIVATAPAT